MRYAPVAVHRVTMEPAADVVTHAAQGHGTKCREDHVARFALSRARVLSQEEEQFARPGEFRGVAEAAASRVEGRPELLGGGGEYVGARHRMAARLSTEALQPFHDGRCRAFDLVSFVAPDARDLLKGIDKPRPPPPRCRRIVGPAVEGAQLRREPYAHRPPAGAGRRLYERHVDAIDVRPLFAIDLDRDEVTVEDL